MKKVFATPDVPQVPSEPSRVRLSSRASRANRVEEGSFFLPQRRSFPWMAEVLPYSGYFPALISGVNVGHQFRFCGVSGPVHDAVHHFVLWVLTAEQHMREHMNEQCKPTLPVTSSAVLGAGKVGVDPNALRRWKQRRAKALRSTELPRLRVKTSELNCTGVQGMQ